MMRIGLRRPSYDRNTSRGTSDSVASTRTDGGTGRDELAFENIFPEYESNDQESANYEADCHFRGVPTFR